MDFGLWTPDFTPAFTLIEIMIVVAIMGIVMTMSVPLVYHVWHKEPLSQAVRDIVEVCSNARARAILQGKTTEVVFHPKEGRLEVSGGGGAPRVENQAGPEVNVGPHAPDGSGLSAQISDRIVIDMLDVNLMEYRDAEVAHVRFYPNGTCDELTIVLHSDQNQYREISLECTTALADVNSDPRRFR